MDNYFSEMREVAFDDLNALRNYVDGIVHAPLMHVLHMRSLVKKCRAIPSRVKRVIIDKLVTKFFSYQLIILANDVDYEFKVNGKSVTMIMRKYFLSRKEVISFIKPIEHRVHDDCGKVQVVQTPGHVRRMKVTEEAKEIIANTKAMTLKDAQGMLKLKGIVLSTSTIRRVRTLGEQCSPRRTAPKFTHTVPNDTFVDESGAITVDPSTYHVGQPFTHEQQLAYESKRDSECNNDAEIARILQNIAMGRIPKVDDSYVEFQSYRL